MAIISPRVFLFLHAVIALAFAGWLAFASESFLHFYLPTQYVTLFCLAADGLIPHDRKDVYAANFLLILKYWAVTLFMLSLALFALAQYGGPKAHFRGTVLITIGAATFFWADMALPDKQGQLANYGLHAFSILLGALSLIGGAKSPAEAGVTGSRAKKSS